MDDGSTEKKGNWIIAQRWSHVLFLSFRCDADLVRQKIPPELEVDCYDGSAWLSIVPFYMSHIRFRLMPVLPMVSLWELNLRTYVKCRGRPGIYFFTLDTDSWLGEKIARYFFHLPYRLRTMKGRVNSGRYSFESSGSFKLEAKPGALVRSDPLDTWLVERYHLYTNTARRLYCGDVMHDPWQLRQLDALSYEDLFSGEFGFEPNVDVRARCSEPLNVRFKPFTTIKVIC